MSVFEPSNKNLVVMKFGGTSLGSADRIRQAAEIVRNSAKSSRVVVVVSAMAGVTDAILRVLHAAGAGASAEVAKECSELEAQHDRTIAQLFGPRGQKQLCAAVREPVGRLREVCRGLIQLRTLTPQVIDMASSLGEEMSARICSAYFQASGIDAEYLDAARLIVTDDRFGDANPDLEATRRKAEDALLPLLDAGRVPVVTGFRGATPAGQLTTLGRGGSDCSATVIGAAIHADEVWIWTDVDGVLTADPRTCPQAATLPEITFNEAVELSYYGAKVIHPRATRPCMEAGIPVWIKNSFRPQVSGTKITTIVPFGRSPVRAVTAVPRAALVTLTTRPDVHFADIFGRLFLRLAHEHIDVLFSTQSSSENSFGLVLREEDADTVVRAIKRLFRAELKHGVLNPIVVESELAVVAVLGQRMKGVVGILGRLFSAVARRGVSVIAVTQGASELNICFAVPAAAAASVVEAVHEEFLGSAAAAAPAPVADRRVEGSLPA